jgi:hypothetical protein
MRFIQTISEEMDNVKKIVLVSFREIAIIVWRHATMFVVAGKNADLLKRGAS